MSQSIIERISVKEKESRRLHITAANAEVRILLLAGLLVFLLFMFLLNLMIGSVSIPVDQVTRVLLGEQAEKQSWTNIVLKLRLPKALAAVLAGAALGVSGLTMQTFFRNPLAGPFILGISSGASLGVALVVLATGTVGGSLIAGIGFSGDLLLAFAAAIGAGATMLIVLFVARSVRSSMTLLILGLMFSYFTGALVSMLLYFAVPERIQAYINWTFGSFSGVTWGQLQILAPMVLIGLGVGLTLAKSLNALLLGETYAQSMGLNIRRTRITIIGVAAVLTGTITAFCGPIGFIGIAIPHLCRALFKTSDHRLLLPATLLMGGVVALAASIVAEVPGSTITLPLNAVTALIGAPVVIAVILRQRNISKVFSS